MFRSIGAMVPGYAVSLVVVMTAGVDRCVRRAAGTPVPTPS